MLQIKKICKQYKTGGFIQNALDGVSLNLRENEFVAILGPSGSGKTTLLNIIGGLDRYDSGDLIINGISTKKYKDRDWDSYRNHTIGFVFQSYNLIPHQNILSNVELALTISGISKAERRKRAQKALEQVGLGEQLHKKPGQMSGGQMQRVAIARALVNDPDILLADEPTGALDSDTSIQVMDLLKEVAKERLVVMVTHNPELAQSYATRIVKLKDGKIRSDSHPLDIKENSQENPVHKNMGKTSMSFLTALSLSFHNLRTKKARTLLTSFAGSIGIIGIALILSLSNGVSEYIKSVEEDTLSEYPLQIQRSGIDMTAMMEEHVNSHTQKSSGEVHVSQRITSMLSKVDPNDLESLKLYLDSGTSGIESYTNAIEYSYDVTPQIYRLEDNQVRQVNPDRFFTALGLGSASGTNSMMSAMMNTNVFHEMPDNAGLYQSQYDVKAGRWPQNYKECVVVLTSRGSISDLMLYTMGLRDSLELEEMIRQFMNEEKAAEVSNISSYSYQDFLGITFHLVNSADHYEYDPAYDLWKDKSEDDEYMRNLVSQGDKLTIVGVVQPSEDTTAAMLSPGIGYPASLTRHVIQQAESKTIVQQQLANKEKNVFSGRTFGEDNQPAPFDMTSLFHINEEKLREAFQFDENALGNGLTDSSLLSSLLSSAMPDLSQFSFAMPELSALNAQELLGQLDLSFSSDGLQNLVRSLAEGYQSYAVDKPEADYFRLNEYAGQYLQSPEARSILTKELGSLIQDSVEISISAEPLQNMIQDLMEGYLDYASSNKLTDPEQFSAYLTAYLQTPEAQQKFTEYAPEILKVNEDISISPEQTERILNQVLTGYEEYAAANHLPDPRNMGEHFSSYLQQPQTQQQLSEGIQNSMDLTALQEQLSSLLKHYTNQLSHAVQNQITAIMEQIADQASKNLERSMQNMIKQMGANMQQAFHVNPEVLMSAVELRMNEQELSELLRSLMSREDASYDSNIRKLGYAELNKPSQIAIYPKDFESKASVLDILETYNSRMEKEGTPEKVIRYTDVVGTLMSSVTDIIDTISYVLIAFVAISLVVSSIMIGVITYISVLERKKEIGILRAIGSSKRNISQVFNAETFIIGFCAGLIGIGLTLLLLIPGNALIHALAERTDINASLPFLPGIVLILLSIGLTLLGGLIPSKKAAKSDPVAALRAE
ncbi:MAG: ABC transporter ATP-binding protein/permease [Lachnospiraceae bacterium]|nr:ABC transporter ATP-binding protein/permease [Lachnospiraceae bacterium]